MEICLEWGKTGEVPEARIKSYIQAAPEKQSNGKKEAKVAKSVAPLKKQIQRKQLAKGVNIL